MPIKYNLTKYDRLAQKFHELSQKRSTTSLPNCTEDEILKAEAILIASFSSAHSWQTSKMLTGGDILKITSSSEIKTEFAQAESLNWRRITNSNIQDVSRMCINDNTFYAWLAVNVQNGKRNIYKTAWSLLKKEFNEECDGISIQQL